MKEDHLGQESELQRKGAGRGRTRGLGLFPRHAVAEVDHVHGYFRRGVEGGQEPVAEIHRHLEKLAVVPVHQVQVRVIRKEVGRE